MPQNVRIPSGAILLPNIPENETGLIQMIRMGNSIRHKWVNHHEMSLVMRKPTFCICENKDTDQLRGYREADQRLCFRYIDSTIPLLSKSEISSLYPSSQLYSLVCGGPG